MRHDISGWALEFDAERASVYRRQGRWRDRTIAQDLLERAAQEPDRVCLRDSFRIATFSQVAAEAKSVAAALRGLGLKPGQVVSFQLPNWIEASVINLAAALAGLVVNPIVPIYRDRETEDILNDCQARLLFLPETWRGFDHLAMAERLRRAVPSLEHIVAVRPEGDRARQGVLGYKEFLNDRGAVFQPEAQDPDAVKFVLYTSGTTGRAKGVLHTHNTLGNALTGCMSFWNIAPSDVILMPSPVSHMTGYLWGLEAPFCWGNETILMDRWDAAEAVRLIDSRKVALTVSATPFLAELLEAAEAAKSRLPTLRIFGCGGASVPPDLIRRANSWFANGVAFRVYGTSEAVMLARGFVDPADRESAAVTDGKIVDFDVRVIDDDGREVADGLEGEIIARGPARFVGYVDAAETGKSVDGEGFFHTGDLGVKTSEGAVIITGRKKDLINRGGEKLSAREVEDILMRHPRVQEAAAVAMPHPRLGETICAYVIARGQAPSLRELIALLEEIGVARQKFPERLEVLDEFPRTPAGKVKKDVLRAMIAGKLEKEAGA
jgi:cyclohexanecarboxylate-CoA ligase